MNKRDFLKMLGAGFAGASATRIIPGKTNTDTVAHQDVAERILDKDILRVAYIVYPPYFTKDLNTGKFGGMYYEMVSNIADMLGVKIEWVEEVSFSNPFEGFFSNRYDLVGANVWPTGPRLRRADFTKPVCYSGFNLFIAPGKADKYRNLNDFNRTDVRIAVIEGESFEPMAKAKCPQAQLLRLPNTSSNGELVMQIASGKADATFLELAFAAKYTKDNPHSIVPISPDPLQIHPNGFSVGMNQYAFKTVLDHLIDDMLNSGFIAGLLNKYQSTADDFVRVAKPYQLAAAQ